MSTTNQTIIPMLSYEDGVIAMEWLCKTFGFKERERMLGEDGRLAHGEVEMNGNVIMLASPTPHYQSPKHHREVCEDAAKWLEVPFIINGVLVYVNDIEQHYEKAKSGGAKILSNLEFGFPGTRYRAEDLEGQRWMFMEKKKD
jgi:uncharacterized glyoxalase superfamily protein PhnB